MRRIKNTKMHCQYETQAKVANNRINSYLLAMLRGILVGGCLATYRSFEFVFTRRVMFF